MRRKKISTGNRNKGLGVMSGKGIWESCFMVWDIMAGASFTGW